MKKAILSLGLFSMMMLLTSFTTSEVITVSQDLNQSDTGGGQSYIGAPMKKKDFTDNAKSDLSHSSVNIESYKILYRSTDSKKLD